MKKLIAFAFIVLFLGAMFTSCASKKPCPAYSKNTTQTVERTV